MVCLQPRHTLLKSLDSLQLQSDLLLKQVLFTART